MGEVAVCGEGSGSWGRLRLVGGGGLQFVEEVAVHGGDSSLWGS